VILRYATPLNIQPRQCTRVPVQSLTARSVSGSRDCGSRDLVRRKGSALCFIRTTRSSALALVGRLLCEGIPLITVGGLSGTPHHWDCGEDTATCAGALNMLCARNISGNGDYSRWWGFESCLMNNQSTIPANAGHLPDPACVALPACTALHRL
jgi:hypothetical protein